MAIEEVGLLAQIETGGNPLSNLGYTSFGLDTAGDTKLNFKTAGHTLYVDFGDGHPTKQGQDIWHEYTTPEFVTITFVSLDNWGSLNELVIQIEVLSDQSGNASQKVYISNLDFSGMVLDRFRWVSGNEQLQRDGEISASRFWDEVRVYRSSEGIRLNIENFDNKTKELFEFKEGPLYGSMNQTAENLDLIIIADSDITGTIATPQVYDGTTDLRSNNPNVSIDFDDLATNLTTNCNIVFSAGYNTGDAAAYLEKTRKIQRFEHRKSEAPTGGSIAGDTPDGTPYLPSPLTRFFARNHDFSEGPDKLGHLSNLTSLEAPFWQIDHRDDLWTRSGTSDANGDLKSEVQIQIDEVHANLSTFDGNGVRFDFTERVDYKDERINTVVEDSLWKILGLGPYHPVNNPSTPGIIDRGHDCASNQICGAAGFDLDGVDTGNDTVSFLLTDFHLTHFVDYDRNSNGKLWLNVWGPLSGSQWVELIQTGKPFRIDAKDDDRHFEIGGFSYDSVNQVVTLNVEPTPSVTGAKGSVDTTGGSKVYYAPYYNSRNL